MSFDQLLMINDIVKKSDYKIQSCQGEKPFESRMIVLKDE